jgi:hypothetical protein
MNMIEPTLFGLIGVAPRPHDVVFKYIREIAIDQGGLFKELASEEEEGPPQSIPTGIAFGILTGSVDRSQRLKPCVPVGLCEPMRELAQRAIEGTQATPSA